MFKQRQATFQLTFWQTQREIEATYGAVGLLAFDSFIILLKAFSAYIGRRCLSSCQVVCLGIFFVRRRDLWNYLRAGPPSQPPTSLRLFRDFLIFCVNFFGEPGVESAMASPDSHLNCKDSAIDISKGFPSGIFPRVSTHWRAELYLVDVERRLNCSPASWLNFLHSADPQAISAKASSAFKRWFHMDNPVDISLAMFRDMAEPA